MGCWYNSSDTLGVTSYSPLHVLTINITGQTDGSIRQPRFIVAENGPGRGRRIFLDEHGLQGGADSLFAGCGHGEGGDEAHLRTGEWIDEA